MFLEEQQRRRRMWTAHSAYCLTQRELAGCRWQRRGHRHLMCGC